MVQENYGGPLCTPSPAELAGLTNGAKLLDELLPLSSRSALSHAHLIAIFPGVGRWARVSSSSQFRVSGTFFLCANRLSSPWWVAEHLLHEALHQQMYDFRHGHTLLEPDFSTAGAPRVHSLWNIPDSKRGNYWDTFRALAAFHVYVYLAILCTLAERRAPELEEVYGPLDGPIRMTASARALERAQYLAEQLRVVCWQELGPAGRRVVEWFGSVLEALVPSPPFRGLCVQHLIDRYRKEAKEVEFVLGHAGRRTDLPQELMMLARDEVEGARCVLAAVDAEVDLVRLNDALARFSGEEMGTQFPKVRSLIAQAILDVATDDARLSQSQGPDEIVKHMVEKSSESLMALLAR